MNKESNVVAGVKMTTSDSAKEFKAGVDVGTAVGKNEGLATGYLLGAATVVVPFAAVILARMFFSSSE